MRAAANSLDELIGVAVDRGRELREIVEKGGARSERPGHRVLLEHARWTFASRAMRSRFLSSVMFGEAAWDMLLVLYVSDKSNARHTVSGLVELAGVPPTTALRWLDYLEQQELVARSPHPTDKRVYYVEMTDKAREAMEAYFSHVIANHP
jgi:DNA-binding MarR family transcriptional regulator